MKIKKIVLFIIIFLIVIFLKNNVFAVTITCNNWEGVPQYATIDPLVLPSGTNSYLTARNSDRNEVVVLIPYNSDDYIVLNNNSFSGYNVLSNTLTDIKIFTSSFSSDTDSWSTWSYTVLSSTTSYSPINSTYDFISKYNIAPYVNGLGILGNEIISSGIPLPDNIKLTDNIGIFKSGNYYLVFTSDKDNYFVNKFRDNSNTCCSPSGSMVYFYYYTYDTTTNTFINKTYTNSFSTGNWGYSYLYLYNRKDYIYNGGTSTQMGVHDFFDFLYSPEYVFPYIADTDEVLEHIDEYEYTLLLPGSLKKGNLPIKFYISQIVDEFQGQSIFELSLDTLSPYYNTVSNNSNDYFFEIPVSLFSNYLVSDTDYLFCIIGENDYTDFNISRRINYKGATYSPPTEEEMQTVILQGQLNAINNQTEAIENQTEVIEEQLETSKNIFSRIGEILSYLNPFSENFFAYKLIDLLVDCLKSLFIPSAEFFGEWLADLNEYFGDRFRFIVLSI